MAEGKFKFTVKESADGMLWIAAEPMGQAAVDLLPGMLGFGLSGQGTLEEARDLAEFMNDKIATIIYTVLPRGQAPR